MTANPRVAVETSSGNLEVELYADKAPITVANFLAYVDAQFFDNTIFHRVISDFMIQGGGFEPGMKQKSTRANIKNESTNGLQNKRGTLAMARTAAPDSASAQFFINTVDNGFLDQAQARDRVGYCVFGMVTKGMDVVDQIRTVKTGTKSGHENVPLTDVVIKTVRRLP